MSKKVLHLYSVSQLLQGVDLENKEHLCRGWVPELLTWESISVLQEHLSTCAIAVLIQCTNDK